MTTSTPPPQTDPNRFAWIVARLTATNFLITGLALVTSPILARALGPSGRGQVAAVFAIINIAPWVSELGMTAFLSRAHARRSHPLGVLLGSTMPIALGSAALVAALAVPIAHLVGRDRPEVVKFVEIGLYLLPLGVFGGTLNGIALAEQRWGVINLVRVVLTVGTATTIVVLSLLGEVTVETVAITYVAWGTLCVFPYLITLRGSAPWHFEHAVAKMALAFGLRSWLSTVATTGNAQLDQVLMAGLVSSRQLGLYSLAVTLSLASNSLVAATAYALFPRVAAGDPSIAARGCRVTLFLVIVGAVAMAGTSPFFIPIVFGSRFTPMIPMLFVLLGASVFYVPGQILGNALIAGGNPSATARAQVAGLAITVPTLVVVLPTAGGIGAAWASLAAYSVTFFIVLAAAARTFDLSQAAFLRVTRSDLRWLYAQVRRGGSSVPQST